MSGWLSWLLSRLARAWRALLGAVATEALRSSQSNAQLHAPARAVIADRFEIERLAGQGGMGKVYRARDLQTGAAVAVKVLSLADEEGRSRFDREAGVLAALEHPGVVRYVAHGNTHEGTPFLAMEWLEGEDLADHLRHHDLDVEQSVALVSRLAETLGDAHRRGIVHRDVKPSNVFFEGGSIGRVKLLDFGIARVGGGGKPLTATGIAVGTPGYMAPEQARGEPTVGPRADVFSLGCVLYECLCGRRPFTADDLMGVLLKVVLEEPPPLGELRDGIPEPLERLVQRMLAKKPEDRPADGAAVARELAALDLEASPRMEAGERVTPDRPSSLGVGEQRLLCVLVARTGDGTIEPVRRATLRDVVRRLGGRLDVLADGSLLVTVAGGTATDQAAVVARCARAIRSELSDVAIAVVAGRAEVTGRVPVGEVIERGVRLVEGGAGSGVTRVDDVVAALVNGRFEIATDAGGHTLGAELSDGEGARTLLGRATPCVGREREIAALEALFDECLAEPVARAALIRAPAGVGKSRLVRETLARIRLRADSAEIWVGRGSSLAAGAPFGLVAPALRRAAGVLDGEAPELRRQKLSARIACHVTAADQARVTEFIGEMAGVPFPDESSEQLRAARRDPVLMNDQIARAWVDLVLAETASRPLVLVLEDLHWGDLPSIRLVDAGLRAMRDAPLYVLATARPEVDASFPRLWAARDPLEIRLHELTKKSAERLVREVLGERATAALVHRIVERAAGNAFYLEELIRAAADGAGDALPETVLGMVQARLGALDVDARRVLRAAAVFGDVFWRGGVDALLGGESSGASLDELTASEHVLRRPAAKFIDEEELGFRHTLIREAAYAMLTDADRMLGHRLAGDWLEGRGESEAVVLAEHFERGGAPARAAAWYQRAARAALAGNDLSAALARAERGIACLDAARDHGADASPGDSVGGALRGALCLVRAEAHRWRGEHAATRQCAHEAMRWLPRGTAAWYDAIGAAAMTCTSLGDEGLDVLVSALHEATPSEGADGSYLIALARTAGAAAVAGNRATYRDIIDRADAIPPERIAREPIALAQSSVSRAFRSLYAGDPGAYLAQLQTAVKSFERAGDERTACQHRVNLGDAWLELGEFERAHSALHEGFADAERRGLGKVAAFAKHCLALAHARLGRLDEAEAHAREAITALREQHDRRLEGVTHTYLAMCAAQRSSWDDAEREAQMAVELLGSSRPFRLHALGVLAHVLSAQARVEDALAAAREAFDGLKKLAGGIEEGESFIRLVHAEALHAAGDADAAREAIAAARARLLERAERIEEPWRASFLEKIPENARTLELAAAWNGERS